MTLQIKRESLNESNIFSVERRVKVEDTVRARRDGAAHLEAIWHTKRAKLQKVRDVKQRLEDAKHELDVAQRQDQHTRISQLHFATIPELGGRRRGRARAH